MVTTYIFRLKEVLFKEQIMSEADLSTHAV